MAKISWLQTFPATPALKTLTENLIHLGDSVYMFVSHLFIKSKKDGHKNHALFTMATPMLVYSEHQKVGTCNTGKNIAYITANKGKTQITHWTHQRNPKSYHTLNSSKNAQISSHTELIKESPNLITHWTHQRKPKSHHTLNSSKKAQISSHTELIKESPNPITHWTHQRKPKSHHTLNSSKKAQISSHTELIKESPNLITHWTHQRKPKSHHTLNAPKKA